MIKIINILDVSDNKLEEISKQGLLSLTLAEMKTVQSYFKSKRRNPTDVELETIAQTWSEHCCHKTLKAKIEYGENGRTRIFNNLLKETIIKATKKINKKWCVSVFKDNAGIIKFDNKNNVAFKVETHNHPSAIEPYGGAGTGIGGVIRDILGVGLGAKPILNTDIFCFGPPDVSPDKIPEGVLAPKRIFKGVVAGVRDYGNRMGIPTSSGAIIFDEGYISNPLVYCGTVGVLPMKLSFKSAKPGDVILAIGGRTGRDGVHGATFSSASLQKNISASVVQIGNAIVEKKVLDSLIKARDEKLYNAITDCGAGGFSSAVGEMGASIGAKVYLEKTPLKYKGLYPWEIWVSEAQERMILAVPKKNLKRILKIFESENVEATIIGKFTSNKKLKVYYRNKLTCDLDMEFLHEGVSGLKLKAEWKKQKFDEPDFPCPKNLEKELHNLLGSLNISSKEWVIRQYDHEVQGGSILKPLQGINNDGPGDACVVRPFLDSWKGVIVANGINPEYGKIDAYHMASSNIDEAIRNIVSVGGNINNIALLDNFCWGSSKDEFELAKLVRACVGCYDTAVRYRTPFISGKDSLNNEYRINGTTHSIPSTLLISAICVIDDARKVVTMDIKEKGNPIYILGITKNELGGSHYFKGHIPCGIGSVPTVNPIAGRKLMLSLNKAIKKGFVMACHDCSDGGIGVCLAEMSFSGGLGLNIYLSKVPVVDLTRDDYILFSESNTRFLVEVKKEREKEFEKIMSGNIYAKIGEVTNKKYIAIYGLNNNKIIYSLISSLKESWQKPLRW